MSKEQRCYLCCKTIPVGEETNEHFIPRCFYEGKRVPNEPRLSFPSHADCNASTTREEEWIAVHLAFSNPLFGRNEERFQRAMRALNRPQAAGLLARFNAGATELPSGWAALEIGVRDLGWVLAKIVKGLCLRECGVFLGPSTECSVPSSGDTGSVLIAKGEGLRDQGWFNWDLLLHGIHPYWVTTVPKSRLRGPAGSGPNDCMKLEWPRKIQEEDDRP